MKKKTSGAAVAALMLFATTVVFASLYANQYYQNRRLHQTLIELHTYTDSLAEELYALQRQVEKLALQRYPVDVIATGYTPRPEETSGDPLQCAWWLGFQGAPFNGRSVALSDDLLKTIPMGAYIWIEVQTKDGWEWLGRFQVRDRSPQDYPHVDIQMFSLRDAFRFGRKRARIYYLPESSYWDLYAGLLHDIRDPHMSIVEKFRLLGGDLTPIYD